MIASSARPFGRHLRDTRDAGAVAVVVALVVSTVLLGTAAFAVDLGDALARRTDLQGMAEDAARAGAARLPDQTAAARAAITNLCAQPADRTGWNYAGCSGNPPTLAGSAIEFTDDEGNEPGVLVGASPNFIATQITVRPPPITVDFSFGQAIGTPSGTVTATATAGIGTPTGQGVLPFFLVPGDFKVADVPVPATPVTPFGSFQRGDANGRFCISMGRSGLYNNTTCRPNRDMPQTGPPFVDSEQGELDVRRLGQNGNQMTTNIQRGVQPGLRDWSRWPLAGSLRTTTIGSNEDCSSAGATVPDTSTTYTKDVNCLRVVRELNTISGNLNFTERNGFFGSGGRAFERCPGGVTGQIDGVTGVDTTPLLQNTTPLVDTSKGPVTGPGSLLEALTNGLTAPVPGWIRQTAFECPQLALMPVVDAEIQINSSSASYPILGFAYVWIQDVDLNRTTTSSDQGYYFSGSGRVIGLEGYVLPRWYLPELVTNSPTVGPYLGPGWPKQVLVRPCPVVPAGIDPATRLCTE